GTTLIAGLTGADQALLAAAMAWSCWAVHGLLRRLEADDDYILPWSRAARGLATLAMVAATLFIAVRGPHSISAAGTFVLVGSLALWTNLEQPGAPRAFMTLVGFLEPTARGLPFLTSGTALRA